MNGAQLDIESFLEEKAKIINERIEKYLPRILSEESLIFRIIPPRYRLDFEALNKAVSEPLWDFLDRGGKRWRPALFLLVYEALGGSDLEDALDFAIIPEVIHNGTLIADDIEDSSDMRRGKPCTYKIFGLDIAINLSQAMYFLPMIVLSEKGGKISAEKARRLYQIYVHEMANLSLGQAIDIAWHRWLVQAENLTEEHYLQMCAYKTGTLARMAAKMAAVLAGSSEEVVEKIGFFAESIGVSFQIQDDILDIVGEEFAKGKGGLGMDITEGKITLMVLHALRKADRNDREELLRILSMHTRDEALRKKAIEIIKKYGAVEYAKQVASKMVEDSWKMIENLLPESEAKEKIKMLAEYLIQRKI
ncbi:MAG: polyprenyl synthetase family protein [Candidatus Bathyarchaeota archaeon]|nr:polyprenyl synthetase family protein [Candidatus Bathyarchaeota archaeon]